MRYCNRSEGYRSVKMKKSQYCRLLDSKSKESILIQLQKRYQITWVNISPLRESFLQHGGFRTTSAARICCVIRFLAFDDVSRFDSVGSFLMSDLFVGIGILDQAESGVVGIPRSPLGAGAALFSFSINY